MKALLFISLCFFASAERIAKRIYKPVEGSVGCFRRFNGTHQFGCSSHENGNVGVLHKIQSEDDLKWLIEIGPHSPYVALLSTRLFQREMMTSLKESGKVNGVVVLNKTGEGRPERFSIDDVCPNHYSSFYNKFEQESQFCDTNPWNPGSTEFLFEDWGFPIFFVQSIETAQNISQCYEKYNRPSIKGVPRDWPLCAIELKSPMIGAVNTPTCIRRGILDSYINPQPSMFCDPLGDKNIFATVVPTNSSTDTVQNRSVILISTRLDSMSLFEEITPGADSVVTGLAGILSLADMIGRARRLSLLNFKPDISNIVFSIFNGESFDYIGSSRTVFDMEKGIFPRPEEEGISIPASIRLHHIKYFFELEQLGSDSVDEKYFVHSDPVSQSDPDVKAEVEKLKNILNDSAVVGQNMFDVTDDVPLPPSSFQSFLKRDQRIPGIVITNHKGSFKNRYYSSEYDTADALNFSKSKQIIVDNIAAVSNVLTSTIYKLATDQKLPTSIAPDKEFIGEVLECFLINNNCTLLRYLMSRNITGPPRPLYVGVANADEDFRGNANTATLFVNEILAIKLGDRLNGVNKTDCHSDPKDDIYHHSWVGDLPGSMGECYRSTVKLTVAVSPAFIIDGYNWTSGDYSTWTESRWQPFTVRYFLKESSSYENGIFVVGVVVFFVSTVLIFLSSRRADVLFMGRITAGTS
ncbi:nicastrin-like [Artemia franciscana]